MSHKLEHLLDVYWGNPTEEDTTELIAFIDNMIKATGVFTTTTTATIENYNISTEFHTDGTALDLNDWAIVINKMAAFKNCLMSIINSGANILITFNSNLGYDLRAKDKLE